MTIVYEILPTFPYQLCNTKQQGSKNEQICNLSMTLKDPYLMCCKKSFSKAVIFEGSILSR